MTTKEDELYHTSSVSSCSSRNSNPATQPLPMMCDETGPSSPHQERNTRGLDVGEQGTRAIEDSRSNSWLRIHDALIEKDYQVQCLNDRVSRLALFESESQRKDAVIAELRKELAAYKKNSKAKDLSYVSMEEHLASNEKQLQERITKVEMLKKQLADIESQLQSATSHSFSLQKELLSKDAAVASLTQENQRLREESKTSAKHSSQLKQECREKRAFNASLQKQVKKLTELNQDLQKRLEQIQASEEKLTASERKVKSELANKRKDDATAKQLLSRQAFLEDQVSEARERECNLARELDNAKHKMSTLCEQLVTLASNGLSQSTDISPEAATSAVSTLVEENAHLQEDIESMTQQLEQLRDGHSTVCSGVHSVAECFLGMKEAISGAGGLQRISSITSPVLTGLQSIQCEEPIKTLTESLGECFGYMQSQLSDLSSKWTQLTHQLSSTYETLQGTEEETDPFQKMSHVTDVILSKSTECQQLQKKLSLTEIEHSSALSGAVAAMRQNEEQRLLEVAESTRQEEQEMYQKQLKEMQKQLEHEKGVSLEEERRNTATVVEELEQVKKDKAEMELEREERKILQLKLAKLEERLSELAVSKSEALDVIEMQKNTLKEKLLEEITCYKEQSEQYAVTIAAMEDKLLALMKKLQLLEKRNEHVEQQRACHQQVIYTNSGMEKGGEKEKTKAQQLEQMAATLKHQLVLVSKDRDQKQARVEQLEEETHTFEDQLHKNQTQLQQQHLEQQLDLKKTLSDQEWIIEQQKQEIMQLQCTLRKSNEQAVEIQHKDTVDVEQQCSELQPSHDLELVIIGRKCIGEKHKDLIQHQRRTVQDLRQKLSDMIVIKPPDTV